MVREGYIDIDINMCMYVCMRIFFSHEPFRNEKWPRKNIFNKNLKRKKQIRGQNAIYPMQK